MFGWFKYCVFFGVLFAMTPTAEASGWRAGDRVSCNWKSLGTYYTGTIAARMGKKVSVFYDDGDREITTTSRCSRIGPPRNASKSGKVGGLSVGARVSCNWQGEGYFYTGRVDLLLGSKIRVLYDEGDEEITLPSQCKAVGAKKSGSGGDGFGVGARVQCNWKNLGVYYSGKIVGRDGKKLKIHYDDGDRETTTIGRCRKP